MLGTKRKRMKKVDIYYVENNKDMLAGSIVYDDKNLKIEGNEKFLKKLLSEPIYLAGGKEIKLDDNPSEFLDKLFLKYKSAYLRATKPYEL